MIIEQNLNLNTNKFSLNSKEIKGTKSYTYSSKNSNSCHQISFGSISIRKEIGKAFEKVRNYTESNVGKLFQKANERIANLHQIDIDKVEEIGEISSQYAKKRQDINEDFLVFRKGHHLKEVDSAESNAKERFLDKKARVVERNKIHAEQTRQIVDNLILEAAEEDPEIGIKRRAASEASNIKKASFDKLKGFAKIAGYKEEKAILEEYFNKKIKEEKAGGNPDIAGSILFLGTTGNGKTTFAKAFADEVDCDGMDDIDRYGFNKAEKERNFMKDLLAKAEAAEKKFSGDKSKNIPGTRKRTIIFIDEFDSIADETSVILDDLEKFFAICSEKYHCTIFACTNEPEKIFKSKDKNGRVKNGLDPTIETNFPCRVALDPPDKIHTKLVFEHYLTGRTSGEINYDVLAEELDKKAKSKGGAFSNSQIRYLCLGKDAAALEQDEDAFKRSRKDITQEDMLRLIRSEETVPAISEKDLIQFKKEEDLFIGSP